MHSKIKIIAVLLLTGICSLLQANNTPGGPLLQNTSVSNEDICTLSPPAFVSVVEVGTSWLKLTWGPVAGAAQFHIITRDASVGTVYNDIYVSGAVNGASISPLPTGSTVICEVRPVCNTGQEVSPGAFSKPTGIIVIDIVVSGYESPGSYFNGCEMGFRVLGVGGCPVKLDGSSEYFRVKHPVNADQFHDFEAFFDLATKVMHITPSPASHPFFTFIYEDGHHVKIKYWNLEVPIARITVTSTTPGGVDGFLFREGIENNLQYTIKKFGPGQIWQSPSLEDRDALNANQFMESSTLSASPNPFTNLIDVQIPYSTEENDVKISLYDLQGRFVQSQLFPGGPQLRSLSTIDLTPGLYLLRVDTGSKSETIKVMKTQ